MNSRALHEELGIKTKAILKDLEHVELQIPEGFETFKGEVVVSSLYVSSLLGTPHKDILKSIRKEVKDLQECQSAKIFADCLEELEIASTGVINGVTESYYKDSKGRRQPVLYFACLAVLARYSAGFRAILSHKFLQYRSALVKYLQAETVAKHIPQKPLSRRYVYIIENIDTENFKVGITTDVATFQTGCDGELSVYYESLVCSNAKNIEAEIHNRFREYKIREGIGREWLSSSLDKLEVIDYLKEQNYVLESSFGEEYE